MKTPTASSYLKFIDELLSPIGTIDKAIESRSKTVIAGVVETVSNFIVNAPRRKLKSILPCE